MAGNTQSAIIGRDYGAAIGGAMFGIPGALIGGAIGIIAGFLFDLRPRTQVNVYNINITININNYSLISSRCCASGCDNYQHHYYNHDCGNRLYFGWDQLTLRCNYC